MRRARSIGSMGLFIGGLIGSTVAAGELHYRIAPDGEVTAKPAGEWAIGLNDPDAQTRQAAAWMLGRIGEDGRQALPQLLALLDDPVESVRDQAVDTLYYLGPSVVPALEQVIEREGVTAGRHDTGVRAQRLAMQALASLGWRSPEAKRLLLRLVLDRRLHAVVRYEAFGGLGRLGTGAPGVVPILLELAQRTDEDPSLRQGAVMTVPKLGDPDQATIQTLGRLMVEDQEIWVRRSAAWALRQFGAKADAARSQLQAALSDPDAEVRLSAEATLQQLTDDISETHATP